MPAAHGGTAKACPAEGIRLGNHVTPGLQRDLFSSGEAIPVNRIYGLRVSVTPRNVAGITAHQGTILADDISE